MPRNSAYANRTGNTPSPSNTPSSRKKQRTSQDDNDSSRLPPQAKGNPAYEQTREDQALCCWGADCPRNSRIVAVLIILVGIGASIWTTEAVTFFTFEAFRNDTFSYSDKQQPEPFQYATQADVGLFSYRLLQVFEYTEDYLAEDENITIDEINAQIIAESNLGQYQEYELGTDQFPEDRAFSAAQTASIWAPILAGVGLIFAIVELCFKRYQCSWLPTAVCLFLAFCFQITTLFLFTSDEFCTYAQECTLGIGGYMSVLAIFCYCLAQTITCCGPRPEPLLGLVELTPSTGTTTPQKKKKKREPTPNYQPSSPRSSGKKKDLVGVRLV